MNWHSRIQTEWKGAGVIERISWIFTIGLPIVAWASGYLPMFKDNTFVIFSFLSYALLIVVVALNISMRKERDKAKKELREEKETAKTSREFSDKIIETDREQFEMERSKLVMALRSLNDAYEKATHTKRLSAKMETKSSASAHLSVEKGGSVEHLLRLSPEESHDLAIRVAKEAGIEL
jgi:hypothetical protein